MKTSPLWLLIFLSFCTSNKEVESSTIDLHNPTKENANLPHLIVGGDKNLYLSWVEKRDTDLVEFYYSRLQGNRWSEPELITSGKNWFVNWADYPMLAVDKQGNMLAHFLAKNSTGTYSYDVNLVMKPRNAPNWSTPIIPHSDGTPTEHGFVSMTPNSDSTFSIIWLDGRNTLGGHEHVHQGSMTLRSAKINLQGEMSEETEIDDRTCDCCQTGSTKTPNGTLIAYRDRTIDEVRDI